MFSVPLVPVKAMSSEDIGSFASLTTSNVPPVPMSVVTFAVVDVRGATSIVSPVKSDFGKREDLLTTYAAVGSNHQRDIAVCVVVDNQRVAIVGIWKTDYNRSICGVCDVWEGGNIWINHSAANHHSALPD